MAVSTWLLSLLEREHKLLGGGFVEKYPGAWLIWEPGEWRPARTEREGNLRQTVHLGKAAQPGRPAGTDTFCFQLTLTNGAELIVGRASGSDVLVNDVTLSRQHLRVREGQVQVCQGCTAETRFGDEVATPGVWRPLTEGLVVRTGGVRLTYLEPAGMLARLQRPRPA